MAADEDFLEGILSGKAIQQPELHDASAIYVKDKTVFEDIMTKGDAKRDK